jgi:hypothetical protein
MKRFARACWSRFASTRRTPSERFLAPCALLDFANAIAPKTPEADARRRRALTVRERDREEVREHFRRLIAAERRAAADRGADLWLKWNETSGN